MVSAVQPPPPSTRSRLSALLIAGVIATVSYGLHQFYRPMSAAIIAILLGVSIRNLSKLPLAWIEASKGMVKRIIPATIVLTGASLNVTDVARVGGPSLAVIVASIGCATFAALAARSITAQMPTILDQILLVLLIIELLYTVQVSFREHGLVAEPFLIVALIAVIRRVLVVTAELPKLPQAGEDVFRHAIMELAILTVMIIVLVTSFVVLRKGTKQAQGA